MTPPDNSADSPLLAKLSDEQREVVLAPPGPLLVLAGAGSGKTRALTQRVAYFLHHGIAQERILLVTFTNLAARQMVSRLQAQAERSLDGMWAGTFHHLAVRVLRRHGFLIGLSERFVILDRNDAVDLLSQCLHEIAPPPGCTWPRATLLQSLLSLSINVERPLAQIIAEHAGSSAELLALSDGVALSKVCDRYALRKLQLALCDFDDLLLGWRLLLCDHKVVRDEQRERFLHLFIDEYQDTSRIQSAICEDIAQGYRSLTVVGDDAQSIYRFRGAALTNLHEFRARWPEARVLHLSTNYRSQPDIVALSNRSIAKNAQIAGVPRPPMRSGWQLSRPAMRPAIVGLPDARLQAEFVRKRLQERLADGQSPSEIAILYRSHRHAREMELALLRSGIPYTMRSGQKLSEQAHIKDVLAFLRLCHNPQDHLSWARVLRQVFGLGDTGRGRVLAALDEQLGNAAATAMPDINDRVLRHARGDSRRGLYRLFALVAELRELLRAAAARNQSAQPEKLIAKLVEHILERHYRDYALHAFADAEQRLSNLQGLCLGLGTTSGAGSSLSRTQGLLSLEPKDALCDFLSAGTSGDALVPAGKPQGVVLSTVHQAKGLEWSVVFVLWLCEGHFPSAIARDPARSEEEEERRLFYVAVTRAREELYLCYPSSAAAFGALRRSRFLDELDGPRGEANPPFERWAVLT